MFSAGAEKEHLPKMDSIESRQKPKDATGGVL